ncbi:MAG: hypothetical protein QXR60_05280 [Candidatus Nanoarchaeia archaeon]
MAKLINYLTFLLVLEVLFFLFGVIDPTAFKIIIYATDPQAVWNSELVIKFREVLGDTGTALAGLAGAIGLAAIAVGFVTYQKAQFTVKALLVGMLLSLFIDIVQIFNFFKAEGVWGMVFAILLIAPMSIIGIIVLIGWVFGDGGNT